MEMFTYAVWKDERRDKDDKITERATILVHPTHVLAETPEHVGILAAKSIDDEHMDDLERIKVVVRPF